MALKYWLEYNDVINIVHRLEINEDGFSGVATEINGLVYLDYVAADHILEAIRGQGLRVELEANNTLSFDDLFNEEQKTFQVIYKRNAITKFTGWLNPEGWFEDFVRDEWIVSFDCVDGLGFLSDLSFVEDATGNQVTGKKTQLEIISMALIRTGLQQNINTNIDIYYTGLATTVNVLANTTVNTARYIKDDGNTITSCDEVLRGILEPYGACIISQDGEWYIYKPNQLFSSSVLNYFRYDYEGVALSPTIGTLDISLDLGSNINGFNPHHINENQQISIKNSIGAYRINYKYGQNKLLLDNNNLCTDDNITIDDWVINSNTNLTFPIENSCAIALDIVAAPGISQIETDAIPLAELTIVSINIKGFHSRYPPAQSFVKYQITLNDGTDTYYLDSTGSWIQNISRTLNYPVYVPSYFIIGFDTDPLPVTGDVKVIFWTPESGSGIVSGQFNIYEVNITQAENTNLEKKGEFHTFQRTTKPSFKIQNTIEVLTGDNLEENYVGALYKLDGTTPTETWFRKGVTESKAILQIMGEETLRMNPTPMKIFSGDIYGFVDYLSVVSIDGISALFMPLKYSYNTKANITNIEFKQIKAGELADIDYKLSYDYGELVTPTIT